MMFLRSGVPVFASNALVHQRTEAGLHSANFQKERTLINASELQIVFDDALDRIRDEIVGPILIRMDAMAVLLEQSNLTLQLDPAKDAPLSSKGE